MQTLEDAFTGLDFYCHSSRYIQLRDCDSASVGRLNALASSGSLPPTTSPTAPTTSPTTSPIAPTTSPTTSGPTTSPTTSVPTTSPTTSAPTSSPTKRASVSSACLSRAAEMLRGAESRIYYRGETAVLPGFDEDAACSTRDTIFNTWDGKGRDDVNFGLRINVGANTTLDYLGVLNGTDANRTAFEYCLSSETGRLTIKPANTLSDDEAFWLQLVAQGPDFTVPVTAPWRLRVAVRADFALKVTGTDAAATTTSGGAARARVEADIAGKLLDAAAAGGFQQNTTFRVPAFVPSGVANDQTNQNRYDSYFEHFTRGPDGSPQVTFEVCSTNLATSDPGTPPPTYGTGACGTSLGDDMFIISGSGKMLLGLDQLGMHTMSLRARSGDRPAPVTILSWQMHVRRGPNGRDCASNQGEPVDTTSDVYTCVCNDGYEGANCEERSQQQSQAAGRAADDNTTLPAVLTFIVLMALIVYAIVVRRSKLKLTPHDFEAQLTRMIDSGAIKLADATAPRKLPRELDRNLIVQLDVLGKGEFGEVMLGFYVKEGEAHEEGRLVALKTLKGVAGDLVSRSEKDTLMAEATINAQFDHINIVNLLGVVTTGQPLLIVLELCPRGELKKLVMKKRVPLKTKLDLLFGVAKGMEYLCSLQFIHRDLAARNVLVDAQMNAKVADFGLSRDSEDAEYYVASGGKAPIRWTSVEALTKKKYSEKSDV